MRIFKELSAPIVTSVLESRGSSLCSGRTISLSILYSTFLSYSHQKNITATRRHLQDQSSDWKTLKIMNKEYFHGGFKTKNMIQVKQEIRDEETKESVSLVHQISFDNNQAILKEEYCDDDFKKEPLIPIKREINSEQTNERVSTEYQSSGRKPQEVDSSFFENSSLMLLDIEDFKLDITKEIQMNQKLCKSENRDQSLLSCKQEVYTDYVDDKCIKDVFIKEEKCTKDILTKVVPAVEDDIDIKHNEVADILNEGVKYKYANTDYRLYHPHVEECGANKCNKSESYDVTNRNVTDSKVLEHTESFTCALCNKCFSSYFRLKMHIRDIHMKGKNNKCNLCNMKFTLKNNLNRHMSVVHGKLSNYACSICDKNFPFKYKLKEHIHIVHFGSKTHIYYEERKYICDLCNERFTRKIRIEEHISFHHSNQRLYVCKECNKRFSNKNNLKSHMKHVHCTRMYKCKVCSKKFAIPSKLKRHVNAVHCNKRGYKCHTCGRAFAAREHLVRHINASKACYRYFQILSQNT